MDLQERQEALKVKNQKEKERIRNERELLLVNRPLCILCKRRAARAGQAYCSRCTATDMVNQYRNTLPGAIVEETDEYTTTNENLDGSNIEITSQDEDTSKIAANQTNEICRQEKTFTRLEVANLLGISATTLMRWERKGKIPQPLKVAHSNHCIYTQEMIEIARAYMNSYYAPPLQPNPATPGTPEALSTRSVKRAVKINKRMERAVANRLGSLGRILR